MPVEALVHALNGVLGRLFDALLLPAAPLGGFAAMAWSALVCGAVAGVLFLALADRRRLRLALAQTWTCLLEVWLYRRDPPVSARVQGGLLLAGGRLLLWVVATAAGVTALTLPLLLQCHARFGHRPAAVGDELVVVADCVDAAAVDALQAAGSMGARVEALVREPGRRRAVMRVSVLASTASLRLQAPGPEAVALPLVARRGEAPATLGGGVLTRLLEPGSQPLPVSSALRRVRVLRRPAPWREWLWFGVLSAIAATAAAAGGQRRPARRRRRSCRRP